MFTVSLHLVGIFVPAFLKKKNLWKKKKDYDFINYGKEAFLRIKKIKNPFLAQSKADKNIIIETTGESERMNFLAVAAILNSSLRHHSFTLRIVVKLAHIK